MRRILLWVIVFISCLFAYYLWLRLGPSGLAYTGISITDANMMAETLKLFIEIFALIIAGFWTYERFIKNREDFPYPEIVHKIEHWDLKNQKLLVRVYVIIHNKGKVKLDLSKGSIYLRQVKPLDDEIKKLIKEAEIEGLRNGLTKGLFLEHELYKVAWPKLGYREWKLSEKRKKLSLEPGETKVFPFDFLIGNGLEIIEVVSFLNNKQYLEENLTDPPVSTLYSLIDNET
jgi:hypothetical protein